MRLVEHSGLEWSLNKVSCIHVFHLMILQRTPAHTAAENGHAGILRMLVLRGAAINVEDVAGVSIISRFLDLFVKTVLIFGRRTNRRFATYMSD